MSSSCARRRITGDGRGFEHLYPDDMPLWDKMRTIAREIYGAEDIIADQRVRDQFKDYQERQATAADLRRQDPVQLLDRPQPEGHPRAMSYRSASCAGRRCRIPGRDLR